MNTDASGDSSLAMNRFWIHRSIQSPSRRGSLKAQNTRIGSVRYSWPSDDFDSSRNDDWLCPVMIRSTSSAPMALRASAISIMSACG